MKNISKFAGLFIAGVATLTGLADYKFSAITNEATGATVVSTLTPDGSPVITALVLTQTVQNVISDMDFSPGNYAAVSNAAMKSVKKDELDGLILSLDIERMTNGYETVAVLADLRKQIKILAGYTSVIFSLSGVQADTTVTMQGFSVPGGKSVTIEWGDGTSSEVVSESGTVPSVSHTYTSAGNYELRVSGDISNVQTPVQNKEVIDEHLRSCSIDDTINVTNFSWGTATSGGVLKNIQSVSMPYVLTVQPQEYGNCSNLVSVTLPECWWVRNYGFKNSTSLRQVDMPRLRVTDVEAFANCTSLEEIAFAPGAEIGIDSFSGCTSLEKVSLSGDTQIYDGAFKGCTALSDFDFSSVTNIGSGVFAGCTALTNINYRSTAQESKGVAFNLTDDLFAGCTGLKSFVGTNTFYLGRGTFSNCTAVVSVDIPNGYVDPTAMDGVDFVYGCTSLESLVLFGIDSTTSTLSSNFSNMFYNVGSGVATSKTDIYGNTYKCEIKCTNESVQNSRWFTPSATYFPYGAPTTTKFTGYDGYIVYDAGTSAWIAHVIE